MTRDLPADITGAFGAFVPPSYNRARTIHLRFIEETSRCRYRLVAWGPVFPEDGGGSYEGWLELDPQEVKSVCELLRSEWVRQIIHYEPEGEGCTWPFSELWDLSDRPHLLADKVVTLAELGNTAFRRLFSGDPGIQQIRAILEQALRSREQVISFESENLCMPWGMIYTSPYTDHPRPTEEHWSYEGFWGYQHIIEHTFERVIDFDPRILIPDSGLTVGMNVDHRIDADYKDTLYIDRTIQFFRAQATVVVRSRKREVAKAFQDKNFADNITFFGCHAQVSGEGGPLILPYLQLDQDDRIHGEEIKDWLQDPGLATRPFVYIGACEGGQVGSTFYSDCGGALLGKNGGRCLLGPQLPLPPGFAAEYSSLLFTEFTRPGTKLGDIVKDLTHKFIEDHENPLGLMFSLYRGIDVHLWPEGAKQ
ncbi:hypothetical protein JMUB6875_17010 [Nocardia sp. JMUB6875]|uniref:hypothetical protein n=1 Tax=Nocardia sp. JMUB6875 TaxID=3158170 RepID=UPI0032E57FAA